MAKINFLKDGATSYSRQKNRIKYETGSQVAVLWTDAVWYYFKIGAFSLPCTGRPIKGSQDA